MRLPFRLAIIVAVAVPLWGCGSLGPFEELYTGSIEQPKSERPSGQVYLFRGFIGGVFSRGMDTLAEKVRHSGVNASAASFTEWQEIADDWIARYRNDPARPRLVLIGHSMGGTASLQFAARLKAADMPVSLIVAFDPARMPVDVPPNVERFVNLYQSNSVMGAGDIAPDKAFRGSFASVNLKERSEIIHVNIDKSEVLHEAVLAKIVQATGVLAAPLGASHPIRYAPPPGVPIELWDGGVAVTADAGETVASFAAKYAVPAWAVASINHLSENDALRVGQSLVVPRFLVGGAALSRAATSYLPERPGVR